MVSSSSAWAHAIICDERTTHVCYCHNPFRYAWSDRERTLADHSAPSRARCSTTIFRRWRQWDWIAAQRVDRYITNSRTTQGRIRDVLEPGLVGGLPAGGDQRASRPGEVGQHYLVLSELMPHKRIDVTDRAPSTSSGLPLVVCGDGPEARSLRRIAGPTVKFVGRVSDPEAARLLSSCRALVVAAVEEFGIAAVEAQAAGRPVIAVRDGGTLETVVDGETGCFWSGGPDELAAVVAGFDDAAIDPDACVRNAARFDTSIFKRELPRQVESALARGGPAAATARVPCSAPPGSRGVPASETSTDDPTEATRVGFRSRERCRRPLPDLLGVAGASLPRHSGRTVA